MKGRCPRPLDDGAVAGRSVGPLCAFVNRVRSELPSGVLRFYKFRQELFGPVPAKDVYVKRPDGRGWPEECPPIRAANAFGFDLLANFDVTFIRQRDGTWEAQPAVELTSDFDWSPNEDVPGRPMGQRYCWFWNRGQSLPHAITDDVFEVIRNQVKVSSFLYLATDANELLSFGPLPNAKPMHDCGWRTYSAMAETDWYPASSPWHVVLELDPQRDEVHIEKGEPICRVTPVRRDTYFASPMSPTEFDGFFERSQRWLNAHGRPHESAGKGERDITRTYVKQQARSKFIVLD